MAYDKKICDDYVTALEKINQAKFDFLCARDAQHAAVKLSDYTYDEFFIKKAELAKAKLDAKPAIKAYKQYCANKELTKIEEKK